MSFSTTRREGHDAYLHALDRAVTIGIVLSLAVHAVLIGLLPNPFHHFHPPPRTLEVELVELPPPPRATLGEQEPLVEPPPPVAAGAPSKPEPLRSRKTITEPKSVRERPAAALAPTVRDRLLTHAEPEKDVTSAPAQPEAAAMQQEPAAAPSTEAKGIGVEAAPQTPPSFQAAYLHNPEPFYPSASRRLGEQGSVQLRVLVHADGHAADVEVHRSSGFPRLDEAASEAVRKWRFVPAKRGATPVEATVIVPVVFRLEAE